MRLSGTGMTSLIAFVEMSDDCVSKFTSLELGTIIFSSQAHHTTDCFDDRLLLRRQIRVNFPARGLMNFFLFSKINKRICGLQLMMENIFNVWRYCSSNLTLFQV